MKQWYCKFRRGHAGRCSWAALVLLALLWPVTASAQTCADQIDVRQSRVWNSPGDLMTWNCTATITSVLFTDVGFPVDFNRRDGADRWTDQRTPGWDGDLQYTVGMCLLSKQDAAWDCSAVVQMWHGRQRQDPNATAAPYAVDREWFYDPNRWGPLYARNPLPNEQVGIFVCRGDCRANTPPTRERSNIALVTWDRHYTGSVVVPPPPPPPPDAPPDPPAPPVPPIPPPAPPSQGLDVSQITERLDQLAKQLAEHDAHLTQHDERPMWLTRVMTNAKTYIAAIGVVAGYFGQKAAQ